LPPVADLLRAESSLIHGAELYREFGTEHRSSRKESERASESLMSTNIALDAA